MPSGPQCHQRSFRFHRIFAPPEFAELDTTQKTSEGEAADAERQTVARVDGSAGLER